MSPETIQSNGDDHIDIGKVGIGRSGDTDIPLDERILQSRLERISWELDHRSPPELIGVLIESCKDLTKEGDGTRFVERVHVKVSSQK